VNEEIDVRRAETFLNSLFNGTAINVAVLGEGAWSKAFAFQIGADKLVARFGAYREDFEKDEYAMNFAGADLPVPRTVKIGEAFDGYFAISERHSGQFLENLGGEEFERLTPKLLRLFDAMREVRVDQSASAQWPARPGHRVSWREWLSKSVVDDNCPTVGGWRVELARNVEINDLFEEGVRVMRELLLYCPNELHVIHGDLLNRNVLVSDDSRRFAAVFDWGCPSYGDFLYDVAWLTSWAPWHEGLKQLDTRSLFRTHFRDQGVEVPDFDERLACYELQIGLTHLAYNTVIRNQKELHAVAIRTKEVLAQLE
jgi:hygromycin-B 4-O-kinase